MSEISSIMCCGPHPSWASGGMAWSDCTSALVSYLSLIRSISLYHIPDWGDLACWQGRTNIPNPSKVGEVQNKHLDKLSHPIEAKFLVHTEHSLGRELSKQYIPLTRVLVSWSQSFAINKPVVSCRFIFPQGESSKSEVFIPANPERFAFSFLASYQLRELSLQSDTCFRCGRVGLIRCPATYYSFLTSRICTHQCTWPVLKLVKGSVANLDILYRNAHTVKLYEWRPLFHLAKIFHSVYHAQNVLNS